MITKDFLISYDISDEKRLKKVAKILEKEALRIQYSLFFYENATKDELMNLLDKVLKIIDHEADDLRVYTIKDKGIALKSGIDLNNPYIVG